MLRRNSQPAFYFTGTKSIKIDQEMPELISKTKWHVFMAHGVQLLWNTIKKPYTEQTVCRMVPLYR